MCCVLILFKLVWRLTQLLKNIKGIFFLRRSVYPDILGILLAQMVLCPSVCCDQLQRTRCTTRANPVVISVDSAAAAQSGMTWTFFGFRLVTSVHSSNETHRVHNCAVVTTAVQRCYWSLRLASVGRSTAEAARFRLNLGSLLAIRPAIKSDGRPPGSEVGDKSSAKLTQRRSGRTNRKLHVIDSQRFRKVRQK